MAANGSVVEVLDLADLDPLVAAAKRRRLRRHRHRVPVLVQEPHARTGGAAKYLADRLPDVALALSHQVSPEWREFERTSTTVMDSYLAPVVRKYLETLRQET